MSQFDTVGDGTNGPVFEPSICPWPNCGHLVDNETQAFWHWRLAHFTKGNEL